MQRLVQVLAGVATLALGGAAASAPVSLNEILSASPQSDWKALDPGDVLVMQLASGRVAIELAPQFAPQAVASIKALVRAHYFDGAAIVRAQDNYVVQWSRSDHPSLGAAKARLPPEFDRALGKDGGFVPLTDPDTYAPQTGFLDDFAVARGGGREWLTHCYGMVGVGRDNAADSGNGSELYAVIGQAPRNLDRNVTLVGRVVEGMEHLSTLPRGTGALGFYEKASQNVPIVSVRLASDLPPAQRPHLEALRTDSRTFRAVIAERRARRDPWYIRSPGHVGVCNVPLPVREMVRKG